MQAKWYTVTPSPAIQIVSVQSADPPGSPPYDSGVLIDPVAADGYNASFFWNGATQTIYPVANCCGGMSYGTGIGRSIGPSQYFGWSVTCELSTCGAPFTILSVHGLTLTAIDDTPPTITPVGANNVASQPGRWIRGGDWSASFSATDPTGICAMNETINSQTIPGPTDWTPDTHSWTQCPATQAQENLLDTTQLPNGWSSLTEYASDATSPANAATQSYSLQVDNQPVTLALSGPTDALSTDGTQYVTATATAGPSGTSIACSVDGSPYSSHAGPSAQIPVSGLGAHHLNCYAQNGAADVYGQPGTSPTQTWTLTIRQPTTLGISFRRLANALRCRRATVRVSLPAHWMTVRRHGKPKRVHVRPRRIRRRIVRCRARTVRKRIIVWKTVMRHGRRTKVAHVRYVRVVALPRHVFATSERVAFGRATTVSGWLGTTSGNALADQPVQVLAAPDNGQRNFVLLATVTTAADGSWTARLPAGPSRLIVAIYPGSQTLASAGSLPIRAHVSGRIRIRLRPHLTHWGGRILITGRLLGGYIPPSGEVVALRIGWPGGSTEIGHLLTDRSGRFSAPYRFLRGYGTVSYWIWASSAPESDYPYSPARSRRVAVTVAQG